MLVIEPRTLYKTCPTTETKPPGQTSVYGHEDQKECQTFSDTEHPSSMYIYRI